MSSEKCKEDLVRHTRYRLHSKEADWKRLSKKTVNDATVRVFEHKPTKTQYSIVTHPDSDYNDYPWESGDVLFGISNTEDGTCVSFTPRTYFEREGNIPDWHVESTLKVLFNLDHPAQDEVCENMFMFWADENCETCLPNEEIRAYLEGLGFIYDDRLDYSDCYN